MREALNHLADKVGAFFDIPPRDDAKRVLIEVADKYPGRAFRAFRERAAGLWRRLINVQRRVLGSRDRHCITVITGCRIRLVNDYTVQIGIDLLKAEPLASLPLTIDERAAFLFTANQDDWYEFMVHRLSAMKGAPPLPSQTVEGYYEVIDRILATHGVKFPSFVFDLMPPEEPYQDSAGWPKEENPLIVAYVKRTLGSPIESSASSASTSSAIASSQHSGGPTTSTHSSDGPTGSAAGLNSVPARSTLRLSAAASPGPARTAGQAPTGSSTSKTRSSAPLPPTSGAYGGQWYSNPLSENSPTGDAFDPRDALLQEERHLRIIEQAWAEQEFQQPKLSYYDLPDAGYKPLDAADERFTLENVERCTARHQLLPRIVLNMIPGVRELDTQGEHTFRKQLKQLVNLGSGDYYCGNLTVDLNAIRSQFKPPEGYMQQALPPRKTIRVMFGGGTFDYTDELTAEPLPLLPQASSHFDEPHQDRFGAFDVAAGTLQPLFSRHELLRSRSHPFETPTELTPAGSLAYAVKKDGVRCQAFRWQMAYEYIAVGFTMDETEKAFVKRYGLAYYDVHFSADLTDCRGRGDCVFRAIAALLRTTNLDVFNVARIVDKTITLESLAAHQGLTGDQIRRLITALHVRTYVIHMRLTPDRSVGIAHVRTVYDFPVTYNCPQGHMSIALCLCEDAVAHACVMYGAPEEPLWEGPVPSAAGLPDGCDHAHDKPSQRDSRSANSKTARQHQARGESKSSSRPKPSQPTHSKRWKKGPKPRGPQPGQSSFYENVAKAESEFPIFRVRTPPQIPPSMQRQIQRGGLNLSLLAPPGLSPNTPAKMYQALASGTEWVPALPFIWEYNSVTVQVQENGERIFDGAENRRYVTVGWRRAPDARAVDDVQAAMLQGERDQPVTCSTRAPGWEVKLLRGKEIPPGRYSESGLLTPEGEFILFQPLPLNIVGVDILRRINWLVLPDKVVANYNKLHEIRPGGRPRTIKYYSKNLRMVNQEGRLLGLAGIDNAVLHNSFGKDFFQDTRMLFLAMGYDLPRYAFFTEDPLYMRWLDNVFSAATDKLGAAFNPDFRWAHPKPLPALPGFMKTYSTAFNPHTAPQSLKEIDQGNSTAMRAQAPVYENYVGTQGKYGFTAECQAPTKYSKNHGKLECVLVHMSGRSKPRKFVLSRLDNQRFVKSLLQDAALADPQIVNDTPDPLTTYGPAVAYSFYLSALAREHTAPAWFYKMPARRQNPFRLRIKRLPPRYESETAEQKAERTRPLPKESLLLRRSNRLKEVMAKASPPTTGFIFNADDARRVSKQEGGVSVSLPVNHVNRTIEVAPRVAQEIQSALQDPLERASAVAAFESIYQAQADEPEVVPHAARPAELAPGGRLCACRNCSNVLIARPGTPCPAGSSHPELTPAYAHLVFPCPMCSAVYAFPCPRHATGDAGPVITLTYEDLSLETVVRALNGDGHVEFVGGRPGAYDNSYKRLANLQVKVTGTSGTSRSPAPRTKRSSRSPPPRDEQGLFRYIPKGSAALVRSVNALPEEPDGKVGPKRLQGHENVDDYDENYMVETLGDMPKTLQREVGLPPIADTPQYKRYFINGHAFTATQLVDKVCLFIDRRMFAQGGEMAQAAMESAYIKAAGSVHLTAEEIQRQRAVTYFIVRHMLIGDQKILDLILPRNLITEAIRGAQAVDDVVQNLTGSSVTQLVHGVADVVTGRSRA